MFLNEPVFGGEAPVTVASGQQKSLSVQVNTRLAKLLGQQATGISGIQWQKRDTGGQWQKLVAQAGRFEAVNSLVLVIKNAQATDQGAYRVRASHSNLTGASDPISLTVGGGPVAVAPAPPSNLTATAVSASQINLTWADNSNNETGFKLQRRSASSATWDDIQNTAAANGTAFSNTAGLSPNTGYVYRVAAYNAAGSSGWSGEATATTRPPATTTWTVAVVTEPLGLPSFIGITTDTLGHGGYPAPFQRIYLDGARIVVAAPSTANGKRFQGWKVNGAVVTAEQSYALTIDANRTADSKRLVAVYGDGVPTRSIVSGVIEGPTAVAESRSAQFRLHVTYSDGLSEYIPATWALTGSAATINSASGLLDAGSVSSDQQVDLRASFVTGGLLATSTPFHITITNTNTTATYTLTLNQTGQGTVLLTPNRNSFTAGDIAVVTATGAPGWHFDHFEGDFGSNYYSAEIRMDRNKTITAVFALGDTRDGSARVFILPEQMVAAGARWRVQGHGDSHTSGETESGLANGNNYVVAFSDVDGWTKPANRTLLADAAATNVFTGEYTRIINFGPLQVNLQPPSAVVAGAQWRLDGGEWQASSVTLPETGTGAHTVDFKPVTGWSTPSAQNITIVAGQPTLVNASYVAANGVPIIQSIGPRNGPLAGGTLVIIEGANFGQGAQVKFGGIAAASVTVESASRLVATTPAGTAYVTVPVAVTTGGTTVSDAGGFTYIVPRGENIDLIGQVGGTVNAVAFQTNILYVGEGAGLVIYNVQNPASPVPVGRIMLPEVVQKIAVSGNYVYVAAARAGLFVVDVSVPASPSVVGFYDTPGSASGVTVQNNLAYVADGNSGLEIFDITNKAAPTLLGSRVLPGLTNRTALATIGTSLYAIVTSGEYATGFYVVDVTQPSNPILSATKALGGKCLDVAVVGSTAYFASAYSGHTIDVFSLAVPANPLQSGFFANGGAPFSIAVKNSTAFVGTDAGFEAFNVANPSQPQFVKVSGSTAAYDIAIGGNYAYLAEQEQGLRIINITVPSSMSQTALVEGMGTVQDVSVNGSSIYAACYKNGFSLVDASNQALPRVAAKLTFPSYSAWTVASKGSTVFLGSPNGGSGIKVISTTASTAQLLSTSIDAGPIKLTATGSLLYAADVDTSIIPYRSRLTLFDTSVAGQLTLESHLANLSAEGHAEYAIGRGQRAYFCDADGLHVVDTSDPANPVRMGDYRLPTHVDDYLPIAVTDDGGYVLYGRAYARGFAVVDVRNGNNPVEIGTALDDVSVVDVFIKGNLAYAACYGNGVRVLDITNPAMPIVVGQYTTGGFARRVKADEQGIYVADDAGGLAILHLRDFSLPTITVTAPTPIGTITSVTSTLSVSGTASDDKGVQSVTWSNSRGGGGSATGTTVWQVNNIVLVPGLNALNFTAVDATGNKASATLQVNFTPPDHASPLVVTGGAKLETTNALLALHGTANDNVGVTGVTWSNDQGGSGSATGTDAWTADIPLMEGANNITVRARDAANNEGTAIVRIIRRSPDTTAPTVSVTFPTDQQEAATSEPMVNVSGEADDDRAVMRVAWSNSRGGAGAAEGTARWVANGIALAPGLNVITVTATDSSGNVGSDALAVTYTPTVPPLPLRLTGAGQITGDAAEGAVLNVGQTYTLRAVPGAGEIFGGWSGSIVSESAQLTFTAEEGMEVVANFMANPFAAVKGGYVGLVETEPFARGMSGSAGVQVTGEGAFSAVLRFGAETVRFAGAFDSKGRFTGQVVRTGKPSLQLVLALELTDGRERLTGLISDGTTTAAINADPALSPAPQRGRYTAVLERDAASTTLPAGIGFGTMIVGADGSVRYAGRLGDGSAVTLDGYVTTRGQWPVYAPLYNGRGALIGRVNLRDIPQTSDLDGRLHWQRPGGSEGDVSLMGSTYARPAVGSRVLGLPRAASNARLTFSDGLLASPVERSVTINAAHQASAAFAGYFKMTLDVGVGTFTGEIQLGGRIGRVGFGGVLLPKTGVGRGQVRFSNGIGEVELAAP